MTSIGIIEDDCNLRKSIEKLIEITADLDLVFSCNSIEKWLTDSINTCFEPNLLLLDIGLPGISGLHSITVLKRKYPHAKLMIVTGDSSPNTVWESIRNGADSYLIKPFSLKHLKEQISIIRSGGAALSPFAATAILNKISKQDEIRSNKMMPGNLTKREKEVVHELVKGLTYKEVSYILKISPTTVNDHLKNIYVKLGVKSKSELISKVLSH